MWYSILILCTVAMVTGNYKQQYLFFTGRQGKYRILLPHIRRFPSQPLLLPIISFPFPFIYLPVPSISDIKTMLRYLYITLYPPTPPPTSQKFHRINFVVLENFDLSSSMKMSIPLFSQKLKMLICRLLPLILHTFQAGQWKHAWLTTRRTRVRFPSEADTGEMLFNLCLCSAMNKLPLGSKKPLWVVFGG